MSDNCLHALREQSAAGAHLTQSAAPGKDRTGAEVSHKSTRLCFAGGRGRGHELNSVLQKAGKKEAKVRW